MPNESGIPTDVLTKDAVRWSIGLLGGQRIHPAFIYYLYLRKMSAAGELSSASASSAEVQDLVRMPGGPEGRPYYRPLRERGDRTGELLRSFWMQDNIAGSWAPSSLKRISPAAWLVDGENHYVLPDGHAGLARRELLFENTVSALAMGCYFLRNDGFVLDGPAQPDDVLEGFRQKFRFDDEHSGEFDLLFDVSVPDVAFAWFEPVPVEDETELPGAPGPTPPDSAERSPHRGSDGSDH